MNEGCSGRFRRFRLAITTTHASRGFGNQLAATATDVPQEQAAGEADMVEEQPQFVFLIGAKGIAVGVLAPVLGHIVKIGPRISGPDYFHG